MAEEWKNWSRRQRIIQQIDEYLKQTNETKSAQELENSLFLKANKEEEYLQDVTKIIKYLKEQAQYTNQNNSALNASPVNAGAGRQMNQLGAPSPGGMINTPGQPQQQQPSPVASTSLEDRAYLEKIKQLQSKYLEPLRDVVQRFDNSDSKNCRKVRILLEIIENPQKRSAKFLEPLKACEDVLDRLNIQQSEHRGSDETAVSNPEDKEIPLMALFEAVNLNR
ncbi:UNVERIFIED_CONTAM: hypothetical protein RMT77_015131 [Armadillidium vulgare]